MYFAMGTCSVHLSEICSRFLCKAGHRDLQNDVDVTSWWGNFQAFVLRELIVISAHSLNQEAIHNFPFLRHHNSSPNTSPILQTLPGVRVQADLIGAFLCSVLPSSGWTPLGTKEIQGFVGGRRKGGPSSFSDKLECCSQNKIRIKSFTRTK